MYNMTDEDIQHALSNKIQQFQPEKNFEALTTL